MVQNVFLTDNPLFPSAALPFLTNAFLYVRASSAPSLTRQDGKFPPPQYFFSRKRAPFFFLLLMTFSSFARCAPNTFSAKNRTNLSPSTRISCSFRGSPLSPAMTSPLPGFYFVSFVTATLYDRRGGPVLPLDLPWWLRSFFRRHDRVFFGGRGYGSVF